MEEQTKDYSKEEMKANLFTYSLAWVLGIGVMFLMYIVVAFGHKA